LRSHGCAQRARRASVAVSTRERPKNAFFLAHRQGPRGYKVSTGKPVSEQSHFACAGGTLRMYSNVQLNAAPVVPAAFPRWAETMDNWGGKMLAVGARFIACNLLEACLKHVCHTVPFVLSQVVGVAEMASVSASRLFLFMFCSITLACSHALLGLKCRSDSDSLQMLFPHACCMHQICSRRQRQTL
jgi:hypothetical protein